MKKIIKAVMFILICAVSVQVLSSCNNINNNDADIDGTDGIFTAESVASFYSYLDTTNTTGFAIAKDGEIIMEKYWGTNTESSAKNIASAGKSVCSILVGIASDKGYLSLDDKISTYIGNGFSDMSVEKEDTITIKSLLSMTSGMDDFLQESYTPNQGWEYSDCWNLLFNVLQTATGQDINTFASNNLFDIIGMDDAVYKSSKLQLRILRGGVPSYEDWEPYQVYCSIQDMAAFGQLILQKGMWNGVRIVSSSYCEAATSYSSSYNVAYGYLFWLNSESGGVLNTGEIVTTKIIPDAPSDMICALGFGDKKIYMVPSLNIVVLRQGGTATESYNDFPEFDVELWEQLNILFAQL